jgi:hypothetical protein
MQDDRMVEDRLEVTAASPDAALPRQSALVPAFSAARPAGGYSAKRGKPPLRQAESGLAALHAARATACPGRNRFRVGRHTEPEGKEKTRAPGI